MKKALRRYAWYRIARSFRPVAREYGWRFVALGRDALRFARDYRELRAQPANASFEFRAGDLYPCLSDRSTFTPVEPIYLLQDAWGARKVVQIAPARHHDVGSSLKSMSIVAQFIPTTMVDIRPPRVEVEGLAFVAGSILELPFPTGSIACLSSLCVIEHIGLGRYGDPLDQWGTEKAADELMRVLSPGGDLLVSLPVDSASRVYFNAHRAFTREHILRLFAPLRLVEEQYIYGSELCAAYTAERGFGTGLYHFRKPAEPV